MALPLQWWLRLGLASSRTPLQNHDTHANLPIRADASERRAEVGPCRCLPGRLAPMWHRHHQQPLTGPGRGTEVPGVGADSRRPIRRVRRAARRPESRPPARTRPRRCARRNVPSICDALTRCSSRGRPRTARVGWDAASRARSVTEYDKPAPSACPSRASRSLRAPRKVRAVPRCRIILYSAIRSAR
jgi:hypothetical protein